MVNPAQAQMLGLPSYSNNMTGSANTFAISNSQAQMSQAYQPNNVSLYQQA